MQVEYKFQTWKDNPNRAALMVAQVRDFFEAMWNGLGEIEEGIATARAELDPKEPHVFHGLIPALREVQHISHALDLSMSSLNGAMARAAKAEEKRAAKGKAVKA